MPFVRGSHRRGLVMAATALSVLALGACSSLPGLGSKSKARPSGENAAAIGVNGYLWRASLDTLSFMPLASADPYGGVIVTDWYVNPEKPEERFKCTVYILDSRLRADGLNVAVFKQSRDANGAACGSNGDGYRKLDPDQGAPASTFEHQGLSAPFERRCG